MNAKAHAAPGLCSYCGEPLEVHQGPAREQLRAHIECATEHARTITAARIEGDLAKAKREREAERASAALVGAKLERERIVEHLRACARRHQEAGARSRRADTLAACAQRSAALREEADAIESGQHTEAAQDAPGEGS